MKSALTLALALSAGAATPALAQFAPTNKIALTGDAVPTTSVAFEKVFSRPSINRCADVAFVAQRELPSFDLESMICAWESGLCSTEPPGPSVLRLVARDGMSAPGTGSTFLGLSNGSWGWWIVDASDIGPHLPFNHAGSVAFRSQLDDWDSIAGNDDGLFRADLSSGSYATTKLFQAGDGSTVVGDDPSTVYDEPVLGPWALNDSKRMLFPVDVSSLVAPSVLLSQPLGTPTLAQILEGDYGAPGISGGTIRDAIMHGALNRNGDVAVVAGWETTSPLDAGHAIWTGDASALSLVLVDGPTPSAMGIAANSKVQVYPVAVGFNCQGQIRFETLFTEPYADDPDVVPGVNDHCIWIWTPGPTPTFSLVARTGDPIPANSGTLAVPGASILQIHIGFANLNYNRVMGSCGRTAYTAVVEDERDPSDGQMPDGDVSGLWAGQPGQMTLVALEGMVAPGGHAADGSPGTFKEFYGNLMSMNAKGQLIFEADVVNADGEFNGLWVWDPTPTGAAMPLYAIARSGRSFEADTADYRVMDRPIIVPHAGSEDGHGCAISNRGYVAYRGTFGGPDESSTTRGIYRASLCRADLFMDELLDQEDQSLFLTYYYGSDDRADFDQNGQWDQEDLSMFLSLYFDGCDFNPDCVFGEGCGS
ncbi:MAG TPA: hypothetical protein VEB22_12270 [Phycisphaerales bacterium]|nr:hypothetical protein [Phycisphaerales bacterium]